MKEITLYDLRVLVESLEDEKVPIVQSDHKTLVDDGVREIQENVKDLYKGIKENQKKIDEQKSVEEKSLLEESIKKLPDLKEQKSDPLLSDKIDSLAELQANQKLLISRLQRQLGSLGGGGAGFIKDLDDVTFDQTTGTNQLLIYNGAKWVGIASTSVSGSGESKLVDLTDVDASNVGDGRFLRYDASSEEFTFSPVSTTNLELIAGDIQSGILTTTSTNTAVVMSISATTYRSVNYQVQVTRGTNYNTTTINVIHDGTTTYMTEYGTINQPVGVATFSSDISSGSLRLLGHPSSASGTTFKVVFTALES